MVKNTHIVMQARMNSKRLPGKVMKPIGDRPMIKILLDRIQNSNLPIVLATSNDANDDILANYVENLGIKVFRGSENNVLERYYLAAIECKTDQIIRITGDNPFVDGQFILNALKQYEKHAKNSRTYLSSSLNKTLPIGFSVEIFSFELLKEAYHNADLSKEFEHVTPYMHQNIPGNIEIISYSPIQKTNLYRLTIDTQEDFDLVRKLIEQYDCDKKSTHQIINVLQENPALAEINSAVSQKSWHE